MILNSDALSQRLKTRLQAPLPGLDIQMRMAPPLRSKEVSIPDNVKYSAILLLLYPHEGRWHIPFMRRAEDGRVHGGQISFPGGRIESVDQTPTDTALREAEEELGIPRTEVEILGNLTEIYIPPSNFIVYPRVGLMRERPAFQLDPKEVAGVIEVHPASFLEQGNIGRHRVDVFGGNFIEAPGYTVNGDQLIWGGTAMMIAEFAHIWGEIR
ncbi:MAG: CoA pyrophosphatase [Bacteroidota bacterium]